MTVSECIVYDAGREAAFTVSNTATLSIDRIEFLLNDVLPNVPLLSATGAAQATIVNITIGALTVDAAGGSQMPEFTSTGAVYLSESASLIMERVTIANVQTSGGASDVYAAAVIATVVDDASLHMVECNVTQLYLPIASAGILLGGNATLTMTASSVSQCVGASGGSVIVTLGSDSGVGGPAVALDSCEFIANSAPYGPIMVLSTGSQVRAVNSSFTNNSATLYGGVGVIQGNVAGSVGGTNVNISLESCVFVNNAAISAGGVWAATPPPAPPYELQPLRDFVVLRDCLVSNNAAAAGPFLSIASNGDYMIDNCRFDANGRYTAVSGGVISVSSALDANGLVSTAHIVVRGSSFAENGNRVVQGGVVWLSGAASAVFANCTFDNGLASEGGVLYLDGAASATIDASSVTGFAAQSGAVAFVTTRSQLVISGNSSLRDCTASDRGGALFIMGFVNISGAADPQLVADACAAQLYDDSAATAAANALALLSQAALVRAIRCTAWEAGGFAAVIGTGHLSMQAAVVQGAQAGTGGSVAVELASSFRAVGVLFTDNSAYIGAGLALALSGASGSGPYAALMDRVFFIGNKAQLLAGAIHMRANSSALMRNCGFIGNGCVSDAGAVAVTTSATLAITNCTFTINWASNGGGGALLISEGARASIHGAVFTGNYVGGDGGAVSVSAAETSIAASSFTSNIAGGSGGAVSAASVSRLRLFACTFVLNVAYTDGGAVSFVASPGIALLAFNASQLVPANFAALLLIANSSIAGNVAVEGDGGGLSASGGFVSVADTLIAENFALLGSGGGCALDTYTLLQFGWFANLSRLLVQSNYARVNGGGIYQHAQSGGILARLNDLLQPLPAPSVWLQLSVQSNSAVAGGGAFFLNTTALPTIRDSVLANNSAAAYGDNLATPGVQLVWTSAPAGVALLSGVLLDSMTTQLIDAFGQVVSEMTTVVGMPLVAISVAQAANVSRRASAQLVAPNVDLTAVMLVDGRATISTASLFGTSGSYAIVASSSTQAASTWTSAVFNATILPCGADNALIGTPLSVYPACYIGSAGAGLSVRATLLAFALLDTVAIVVVGLLVHHYRAERVIKAASPNFLLIVLFGLLLATSAVFTLYPAIASTGACTSRIWLGHLGFILVFSSLDARAYRIHRVFNNASLSQDLRLRDRDLAVIVALILLVAILYLSLWTGLDRPVQSYVIEGPLQIVWTCQSSMTWSIVVYCMEALLLIWGTYLAWSTRAVNSEFNEARSMGATIWVVSVIVLLLVSVIYGVEQNSASSQLLLLGIGIILSVSTVLVVFFAPKLYYIFHIAHDQRSRRRAGGAAATSSSSPSMPSAEPNHNLAHSDFSSAQRMRNAALPVVSADACGVETLRLRLARLELELARLRSAGQPSEKPTALAAVAGDAPTAAAISATATPCDHDNGDALRCNANAIELAPLANGASAAPQEPVRRVGVDGADDGVRDEPPDVAADEADKSAATESPV